MKELAILYHSQSNRSQDLAFACYEGAKEETEVKVSCFRAYDVCTDDIVRADALIFIFPENFAAISGGMKDLLDRVFYPLERLEIAAKPWCAIISAGNAGESSSRHIEQILSGISFKKIQDTVIIHGPPGNNELTTAHDLGLLVSTSLLMGIY